ncbi:MAG: phosphonoacetaldehyde reductase [Synergistaceae bacterium]|jgi:phosphonate metabolism-associated iron-containing alcohol dehydrogenase|nr:phosphonoacetaldehyde reductase [Synergistaceae bacterium]
MFFYNPVKLYFWSDSCSLLRKELENKKYLKPLFVVWNRKVFLNEALNCALGSRAKESPGIEDPMIIEFDRTNPDIRDFVSLSRQTENYDWDLTVAVGGGSVLDMAKSLTALKGIGVADTRELREIIVGEKYLAHPASADMLAVPTTAGTGSEVTPWATLWDREMGRKYSLSSPNFFAKYALILPELAAGLPERATISVALDALCHAAEAYWAKSANPVSSSYSLRAIRILMGWMRSEISEIDNYETRRTPALGSVLAGLAFSNTRTTACHSISYPLTLNFGVEHGVAAALTLGSLLEINWAATPERHLLLEAFGAETPGQVPKIMDGIFDRFQIKRRLSDYGIRFEDIPQIAQNSFTKGRSDNNPVNLSQEDVEDILLRLL